MQHAIDDVRVFGVAGRQLSSEWCSSCKTQGLRSEVRTYVPVMCWPLFVRVGKFVRTCRIIRILVRFGVVSGS